MLIFVVNPFTIKFENVELSRHLRQLQRFSEFFKQQFNIVQSQYDEIKALTYKPEDDPLIEKIKSMNRTIKLLKNE